MTHLGKIRLIAVSALFIAVTLFSCGASAKRQQAGNDIDKAFETIKKIDKADVVNLGRSAMLLMTMGLQDDCEDEADKATLKLIKGTKKMTIADYSSCSEMGKTRISDILKALFANYEKVLEVKDDGETLLLYAAFNENKDEILDVMMFMPEECGLIRFNGKYELSTIAKLMEDE